MSLNLPILYSGSYLDGYDNTRLPLRLPEKIVHSTQRPVLITSPMISFGNFGTGKFLYEWRSHEYRNLKFSMNHERYIANPPMNGLAGVVKNNFSKSGEAASGEIVFYHNC